MVVAIPAILPVILPAIRQAAPLVADIVVVGDIRGSGEVIQNELIVFELKYDKAVDTAIEQIKRRQYPAKVAQYTDNLLLVGITYKRDTKEHWCCIERVGVG